MYKLHPIQYEILAKLARENCLPYSALKPKKIESNLFVYHLNYLLKKRFIEKTNSKYCLKELGYKTITYLSLKNARPTKQPKIQTAIVCQVDKNFILTRRQKEPFKDVLGFPMGKMHLSESVFEAAAREFTEKTSISARVKLKFAGLADVFVLKEKELISQSVVIVFYCKLAKSQIQKLADQNPAFHLLTKQQIKQQTTSLTQTLLKIATSKSQYEIVHAQI